MVKIQEVNGSYTVSIPREYIQQKGWDKGQVLAIGFDMNGDLVLREVKNG